MKQRLPHTPPSLTMVTRIRARISQIGLELGSRALAKMMRGSLSESLRQKNPHVKKESKR